MASHLTSSSSLKSSASAVTVDKIQSPESSRSRVNGPTAGTDVPQNSSELMVEIPPGFMGYLEVYIHQARDIHNICIYHKQDVYAKISLTSDPEASVSTKTINGGGKNPVFNEGLHLNVRTTDCSLKCEIWMLSRVKNYLEDQLLGFAVVPLSDVLVSDGRLSQEFSMSSTDLFHSPAGFVQLSLSYVGSLPEVIPISPRPPTSVVSDTTLTDTENKNAIPSEYNDIEFPDLKVDNEIQAMISNYCDLEYSENLVSSEDGKCAKSEAGIRAVQSFSSDSFDSVSAQKVDTPPSSVSKDGSSAPTSDTSRSFSETSEATGSQEHKEKNTDGEVDSSSARENTDGYVMPAFKIDLKPEPEVVQQDIVDMYMKSMQQFTESLAKMKLPMDAKDDEPSLDNAKTSSVPDEKSPGSKGAKVFYGSRAFF